MTRLGGKATLRWSLVLAGLMGLSQLVAVHAQEAPVPPPRFEIKRFDVQGNTLISSEEIERIVAPYTGTNKDFADIQRALESLEQVYRERGYGVVQVLLPEQDITKGVIQFQVRQPIVGRVLIEGNKHFDNENVRRSLPTVKEGETPNSKAIARNLQLTAEHPVKETSVLLRSGASEDQIDVNVKITDRKPWRVFLSGDNTGTPETGDYRVGFGYQHSNLFSRDHSLTAQYITSPDHTDDVEIYAVGYRVPFYDWNSVLDLIGGYSNVNSGVVAGLFNVSGSGTVGGARWSYFLPKWGEVEQKIALGLDYRAFANQVLLGTQGFVPDITIHPLSLTYSGVLRMATSELSYYGAVVRNIPGGNDGSAEDFQCPRASDGLCVRAGADPEYVLARYGVNFVHAFREDWQVRAAVNGQYTSDALVSGEQFGVGGQDSVRAFRLREVTNDKGYYANLEAYTPDFGGRIGWPQGARARALAFFDIAQVRRNNALPGEIAKENISSVGLGLRFSKNHVYSLRLDGGYVLDGAAPPASRTQGDIRVNASIVLMY